MLGLGFGELVLIFLIALIFIGPKKLPELAKGLGQGLKEFQKAAKGFNDQLQDSLNEENKPKELETTKVSDATQQIEDTKTENQSSSSENKHS